MPSLSPPPLGLYVHFPWCEKKCPYCDFNSHEANEPPQGAYVDAMLADLDQDLHYIQGRPVETLFIGGGTPSLMSPANVKRLMTGISQRLELSAQLEATMEANPGSAEAEKFAGFREAGINRLSLGIQSFADDQLRALGRIHDSDQAHRAIDAALRADFQNYNLDLMHGLPGQSTQDALDDLKTALAYAPPHLSWYQLTIEPNTVFHSKPPLLPIEDSLADIALRGEQQLIAAEMTGYEVSAYARAAEAACKHNLNYWQFGDYLGIGAGAHGKISTEDGRILRYAKRRQPSAYLAVADNRYVAEQRTLEQEEISGEFALNALRLRSGFSLEMFTARTGLDQRQIQPTLDQLIERKLLQSIDEQISTTALGGRFLDTVVAEFFP